MPKANKSTHSYSLSVKQVYQPLARSLTFAVQLVLLFGLSSGSMFVAKGWLHQQGLVSATSTDNSDTTEMASRQSARVIWPQVPNLFPLPKAKSEPQSETAIASAVQTNPEIPQQHYLYQAPAAQPAPRLSYRPQVNTRRVLRPQVRQQPRQQRVTWRGAKQVKAPQTQHKAVQPRTHIPQVRHLLKQEYGVKKTESYADSMKWVRQTLKSYN